MAYREHPIGVSIRLEPEKAFQDLKAVILSEQVYGNIAKLADYYDVDYRTGARWILRLTGKGFDLSASIIEAKDIAKKKSVRLYRKLKAEK